MNMIEKTIYEAMVQYAKRHDWMSFDGKFFHIHEDKLHNLTFHKKENLSYSDAFICLKEYLKTTNKCSEIETEIV